MNNALIQTLIASLIGTTITIGAVAMRADDMVHSAKSATNTANIHQIATVLELYYDDHQSYPTAHNGPELINELVADDYLRSRPLDASVFTYSPKDNGQDYVLTLAQ